MPIIIRKVLGGTWKRISLPDISKMSALEVSLFHGIALYKSTYMYLLTGQTSIPPKTVLTYCIIRWIKTNNKNSWKDSEIHQKAPIQTKYNTTDDRENVVSENCKNLAGNDTDLVIAAATSWSTVRACMHIHHYLVHSKSVKPLISPNSTWFDILATAFLTSNHFCPQQVLSCWKMCRRLSFINSRVVLCFHKVKKCFHFFYIPGMYAKY